jgi:hypothetical protein
VKIVRGNYVNNGGALGSGTGREKRRRGNDDFRSGNCHAGAAQRCCWQRSISERRYAYHRHSDSAPTQPDKHRPNQVPVPYEITKKYAYYIMIKSFFPYICIIV